MATQAAIRQRIRDNVYGAHPTDTPFTTRLGAAIANGTIATVTVVDGTDWYAGDVVEVAETAEQLFIVSISTNVLTVIRSFNGTTAAAAVDAGFLYKNPRYTLQQIDYAINGTLLTFEDWGLHGFGTGSITTITGQEFYELDDTDISPAYGVLSVYYVNDDTLVPVPLPFRPHYTGLGTGDADYSYGIGIHLLSQGNVVVGDPVYYAYATVLDAVTDISSAQEEILVLGATSILLGMAITPATQDPGTRTDRTVQAGQVGRDARWFQGMFFMQIRAQAATLAVQRTRFPSTTRLSRARRWKH